MTGFHGKAEPSAHGVTVYLLPGMTRWQRKAVLRRLRMEASRGYGPELPLPQLALALGVDRLRLALGITAGAVRLHPSRTLLPGVAALALMSFFVLASAGSRLQFGPRAGLDSLVSGNGRAAAGAALAAGKSGARPAAVAPVTSASSPAPAPWLPSAGWAAVRPTGLGQIASTGGGSGHGAQALGAQRVSGLGVEQTCFGAMPGVGSAQAVQLTCTPGAPSSAG